MSEFLRVSANFFSSAIISEWFVKAISALQGKDNETDAVSPSEAKAQPETPDLWWPPPKGQRWEWPQMARPGRTRSEKVSIFHTLTVGWEGEGVNLWWLDETKTFIRTDTRLAHVAHVGGVHTSAWASAVWGGKKIRLNLHYIEIVNHFGETPGLCSKLVINDQNQLSGAELVARHSLWLNCLTAVVSKCILICCTLIIWVETWMQHLNYIKCLCVFKRKMVWKDQLFHTFIIFNIEEKIIWVWWMSTCD